MIKLIIFDLDGVLVEAKNIHFEAFNKALGEYAITWDEHLSIYDGLKTNQKLEMLHERKGLPKEYFTTIWSDKQKYTLEALRKLEDDPLLTLTIAHLVHDGYKIAVCNGMPNDQLVAAEKSNLFFGTDILSDQTRIALMDMAALDGSDNMRLVARYSGGVQLGIGADIVHQS